MPLLMYCLQCRGLLSAVDWHGLQQLANDCLFTARRTASPAEPGCV